MEMKVHLHPEVFDIVTKGEKNVEVRLNDEKRRKLKVGDTLIFLKRPDEIETISAKITDLVPFSSFLDVVDYYEMKRIYLEFTTKEEYINIMRQFYSQEDESKYGVIAIEFEIIK